MIRKAVIAMIVLFPLQALSADVEVDNSDGSIHRPIEGIAIHQPWTHYTMHTYRIRNTSPVTKTWHLCWSDDSAFENIHHPESHLRNSQCEYISVAPNGYAEGKKGMQLTVTYDWYGFTRYYFQTVLYDDTDRVVAAFGRKSWYAITRWGQNPPLGSGPEKGDG